LRFFSIIKKFLESYDVFDPDALIRSVVVQMATFPAFPEWCNARQFNHLSYSLLSVLVVPLPIQNITLWWEQWVFYASHNKQQHLFTYPQSHYSSIMDLHLQLLVDLLLYGMFVVEPLCHWVLERV
jgi:hypothetical protein